MMDTNKLRFPHTFNGLVPDYATQFWLDAEQYKPLMLEAADEIDRLRAALKKITEHSAAAIATKALDGGKE